MPLSDCSKKYRLVACEDLQPMKTICLSGVSRFCGRQSGYGHSGFAAESDLLFDCAIDAAAPAIRAGELKCLLV